MRVGGISLDFFQSGNSRKYENSDGERQVTNGLLVG